MATNKYDVLRKIERVVDSCVTIEQCVVAEKMMRRAFIAGHMTGLASYYRKIDRALYKKKKSLVNVGDEYEEHF